VLISSTGRDDLELAARVEAAGIRWGALSVEPDYASLEAMAVLAEAGRLRPHVQHVLPLEQIGRAHELVETNRTQGKVVISML
jgi:NADPH:quinone reductase-like Zn-dependent oxidoreductase